jgi:hypothetical protein
MSLVSPSPYLDSALVRHARRYWLAGLALIAVVTLVSAAQLIRAPRHYTATQELRVAVLAVPGAPATDAATLADSAARNLSSPSTLSAPALATTILAHISAGEQAQQHFTALSVGSALSASHHGPTVSLSATWTSAQGTQDVLAAAVAALQAQPPFSQEATPLQATERLQADAPAPAAARTPGEESSMLALLFGRLVLGLLAGVLLPFALALLISSVPAEPTLTSAH